MADDIVTRLREQTQLAEWDSDCLHPMIALGREAADEIERLRKAGHLSGAVTSDALRRDGHRACCPDCMTTVERYRAMRDGTTSNKFDPTTTPYAGDPRQR